MWCRRSRSYDACWSQGVSCGCRCQTWSGPSQPTCATTAITSTSPNDESETISGKLIVQMTWYGWSRIMFTWEFARELLLRAGYSVVTRCAYKQTASPFPEIVDLDNRERESLFIEAQK